MGGKKKDIEDGLEARRLAVNSCGIHRSVSIQGCQPCSTFCGARSGGSWGGRKASTGNLRGKGRGAYEESRQVWIREEKDDTSGLQGEIDRQKRNQNMQGNVGRRSDGIQGREKVEVVHKISNERANFKE